MANRYQGTVLFGAREGQALIAERPSFVEEWLPSMRPVIDGDLPRSKRIVYEHRLFATGETEPMGFWVPSHWTNARCMRQLLSRAYKNPHWLSTTVDDRASDYEIEFQTEGRAA